MPRPTFIFRRLIHCISFLILCVITDSALAQRLFQNEENFPQDVRKLIERKSVPLTVEVADGVSALWSSGLSEEQKKMLFKVGKEMYKRNYPTNPTQEDFYACVFFGKKTGKLNDDKLNQFLHVADTTVNENSVGVTTNFFKITRIYITDNKLYKYRDFSGVDVGGNTEFSFGFGREAKADEAVEIPTDIEEIINSQLENTNTEQNEKKETPEDLGWGDTGNNNGWGSDDGWGNANDGWGNTNNNQNNNNNGWGNDDGWGSPNEWGADDWGTDGWSDASDASNPTKTEVKTYDPIVKPSKLDLFTTPPSEGLPLAGPYMKLDNITLTIQTPNDTVQVKNTSGYVVFAKGAFTGEGGRFDWGVLPNVYGEFDKFHFEVKRPAIKAEGFKLYHNEYVDSAVVGQFDYFAARSNNKENPIYPRFTSYKNNVEIKGLLKDVIYTGGLSLVGKKLVSSSLSGGDASIRLQQGDSTRFKATSTAGFVFNEKSVTNPVAQLIIYTTEKDSLTHPGVRLRYDAESEQLLVRRDRRNFKYSPFIDSYHQVNISADYAAWDIKSDTMNLYSLAGRGAVAAALEEAGRNKSKRDSIMKQVDFVTITSNSFFNEAELRALQGLYPFNPLVMAWAYVTQRKPFNLSFTSAELAGKFKQNATHVKSSMRALAGNGFVEYDESVDWVTLTPKGVLYARANLPTSSRLYSDYDQIRLTSQSINSDNLTYYFDDNELLVRGVEEVVYSNAMIDSVNRFAVKAKPVDKQVIIKENRDMVVNGQVAAKNFIFNGKGFEFNYKDFKFDMEKIDSMQFFVEGDTMPNSFKDVSGTFSINLPYNKAGVYDTKRFSGSLRYPLFNTTSGGTVRFGGDEIMGGAYNDSTIRFDVDNFTLDSLAQRKPEDLRFGGTFNTPIFEKFKEPIRVMPDKSLGFTHSVNDEQHSEGMPLYGGKAMLNTGTVVVSNSGIRAGSERYIEDTEKAMEEQKKKRRAQDISELPLIENEPAKMTYIAAELTSNDFIFYGDSVTTKSAFAAEQSTSKGFIKSTTINETQFPDVEMDNFKMNWLPQYDSMMLTTTETPFGMYNNVSLQGGEKGADYTGTLALTPTGLKGYGTFETKDATIESEKFVFETKRLFGRESTFRIKALEEGLPPSVEATNVRFEYNIDASPRTAQITSENIGEQVFDFPSLKYKTSLANAVWVADNQTVAFRVDENEDANKQYFVSTAPEQDSLNFRANFANYHIPSGNLNIGGVPFILVLDTEVYPREGNVVIRKDAKMDKLEDAELIINSIQRYYKLTEGMIDIVSRTEYQGEAVLNYNNGTDKIEYLTLNNFSKQTITQDDIPDSLRKTELAERLIGSEGTVSVTDIQEEDDDDQVDEEDFIYSEGKQFKGAVTLKAWLPELQFNGETRLVIGSSAQTGWFPLVSDGGKGKKGKVASTTGSSILIQDQKIAGQPAYSGIYLGENGLSAPMMQASVDDAVPVFLAEGEVKVKAEEKYISVLSQERAKSSEIENGNMFKISKDNGTLEFDGKLNLFKTLPKAKVEVGAVGKGLFRNQQYTIDAMVGITVESKGTAFTFMSEDLNSFVEENRDRLSLKPTVTKSKEMLRKIAAVSGAKDAQDFQKRFAPNDYGLVDVIDDKTILLSDVIMNWSSDNQTFYSVGEIGIGAILKNEIDVKATGYFELPQTDDRDVFTLYFELDPDKWYYIHFDGRNIHTLSSNEEYNAIITDPKAKDKYELADRSEVDEFMGRFRGVYPSKPDIPLN